MARQPKCTKTNPHIKEAAFGSLYKGGRAPSSPATLCGFPYGVGFCVFGLSGRISPTCVPHLSHICSTVVPHVPHISLFVSTCFPYYVFRMLSQLVIACLVNYSWITSIRNQHSPNSSAVWCNVPRWPPGAWRGCHCCPALETRPQPPSRLLKNHDIMISCHDIMIS